MGKREVKQAVAWELMVAAGDVVEFWTQRFEDRGKTPPCDAKEAAEMIAGWLKTLPGKDWDNRLPNVWGCEEQ